MPPSESEINSLLTDFSPDVVPKFEEYVRAQIAGQSPYHAAAVRRLVKLYQLFPATSKAEILAQALWLALLQFPNHSDFLALKYMIPVPNVANDDTLAALQTCFEQLQACQFTEFWKTYEESIKSSSYLQSYLNAESVKTLQGAILQVMALTYQQAPASIVLAVTKLDSTDAVKGFDSVESVSKDMVVFVATVDNTKRQRLYQASLNFESISALMSKIAQ